ncbi:MAG: VWA domain-containing protein [Blastocatellia bacterium]|nr:VWA domain-containing protein [Blastocatellia bacterium]
MRPWLVPVSKFVVWSLFLLLSVVFGSETVLAQAGVVFPGDDNVPDAARLSLDEMTTDIRIDHQFARVKIVQIYGNHTDRVLESRYVFQIPTTAAITDFAVWDGDIRIPGVMLEVRRANEIYEEIKQKAIDPGLLTEEDENGAPKAFTVRLTPIQPYGTKRVELEYCEVLRVEGEQTFFSLPLKPSAYGEQTVGSFRLSLDLLSRVPMSALNLRSKQYPLGFGAQTPDHISATFQAANVAFKEDFAFDYTLQNRKSQMSVLTYHAPEILSAVDLRDPNHTKPDNDGYFEAAVVFNERGAVPEEFNRQPAPKRSVVVMLDTSLSMNWEKLDRSYEAVERFLRTLTPADSFNLVLFNDDVNALGDKPLTGSLENVEKALQFIKQGYLSGGTDFVRGLKRALELAKQLPGDERAIVLLTDGNPTLTTTSARGIVNEFSKANKTGNQQLARLFAFGIGQDTNREMLAELARSSNGHFDWGRETDELEFRLNAFFAKVGQKPIEGLTLTTSDSSNFYNVYPDVDTTCYDGSRFAFVGRFRRANPNVTFTVSGKQQDRAVKLEEKAALPEMDDTHKHVPYVWARARIDALLRQIALNGEDEALIAEIIALSKKYKIVTPYTAFLAAPRSLLRPRVIKPGDPVLRVKTDAAINSVVAVFPFGLTKPLTYLTSEDIWETRFLAPKEMADGSYTCRLVLTDRSGNVYQEEKSFVIDSHPPTVKATVAKPIVNAGEATEIIVSADSDTRRITARLFGAQPVKVVWDEKRKANLGTLRIPAGLPAGVYTVVVTAEDFAHNVVGTEITVEVVGG